MGEVGFSFTWLSLAHLISGSHKDMRHLIRVRNQKLLGKSSRNEEQPSLLQSLPLLWASLWASHWGSTYRALKVPEHGDQAECQQLHPDAALNKGAKAGLRAQPGGTNTDVRGGEARGVLQFSGEEEQVHQ